MASAAAQSPSEPFAEEQDEPAEAVIQWGIAG
jgi:hypothetical protein